MATLMLEFEHDTAHECERKCKHGTVSTDTKYGSVWQWHEHVPIVDGLRGSKRVAASMTGAENDTQHAHKRGKHERVIATVYVGVEPWRDKQSYVV